MITFMHLTEVLGYTTRVTKENLDVAGYPSPISLTFQKYTPKRNVGHFQL
jgi:hypothetical protein